MNTRSALYAIRQYRNMSERTHRSFGTQVDAIANALKDEAAKAESTVNMSYDEIDKLVQREYPPVYREFPSADKQ